MKIDQLFENQTIIALGTVTTGNRPNLHYVEHQFTTDEKIYFATSNQESTYNDLSNNPNVIIMQFEKGNYTRVTGQVKFLTGEQKEIKKALINDLNPKIQTRYGIDGYN